MRVRTTVLWSVAAAMTAGEILPTAGCATTVTRTTSRDTTAKGAGIGAGAKDTLDQVAAVIAKFPKTAVVVQGHTDSTGSEPYNQALSERRADAVRSYLGGQGVDAGRLTALGYGESAPVADNRTAGGRAPNRRVTILLKAKAK